MIRDGLQVLQEACAFISSSQVAIGARSGKIHGLLFACRSLLQLREATQVLCDNRTSSSCDV